MKGNIFDAHEVRNECFCDKYADPNPEKIAWPGPGEVRSTHNVMTEKRVFIQVVPLQGLKSDDLQNYNAHDNLRGCEGVLTVYERFLDATQFIVVSEEFGPSLNDIVGTLGSSRQDS